MTVREDVGPDDDLFAHRRLDGEPSRVHFRVQPLDDELVRIDVTYTTAAVVS